MDIDRYQELNATYKYTIDAAIEAFNKLQEATAHVENTQHNREEAREALYAFVEENVQG